MKLLRIKYQSRESVRKQDSLGDSDHSHYETIVREKRIVIDSDGQVDAAVRYFDASHAHLTEYERLEFGLIGAVDMIYRPPLYRL